MCTDQYRQQILALYQDYPITPFIHPNRNCQQWLDDFSKGKEKRVAKSFMTPLEDGFLAGHIILIWRIQFQTFTNESVIHKYFEYTYGIDARAELSYLEDKQAIVLLSAMDSLNHQTAGELKQHLSSIGIKGLSSLKKPQLVELVQTHFSEETLAPLFSVRQYDVTDYGYTLLEKHADIVAKHPKKKY